MMLLNGSALTDCGMYTFQWLMCTDFETWQVLMSIIVISVMRPAMKCFFLFSDPKQAVEFMEKLKEKVFFECAYVCVSGTFS